MTTSEHDDQRTGLAHYLGAVMRHRFLTLAITAIVVAAFVGHSLSQPTVYTATATVDFQDPNQDLALTGTPAGVFQTPQELAQIGATTLVNPSLAATVQRQLGTDLSIKRLTDDLSASADPSSGQVYIQATGATPTFTADLANAAANAGAVMEANAERARYQNAARNLAQKAKQLGRSPNQNNERLTYDDQITRLRALSVLAQPVQVTSLATKPQSPSSPKPISDGIIGLILGLLAGVIVSIVRESFNRRLRSSADVASAIGLPILAHIGEDAMGKAGLSDFGLGALSDSELEAFRMLRTHLRFHRSERSGKVILVTSPMPKEGKSTVAASLAFSYAMAGQRTVLIECDFRQPSLAARLGVSSDHGLIDYLLGDCEPQDIVQVVPDGPAETSNGSTPVPTPSVAGPLAAIVAGPRPKGLPSELLETPAFAEFLAEIREAYDAVVIDSAPLLLVADTLELLTVVDSVVMCVRSSQTTRDQAAAGKAALAPAGESLAGVVVTGVSQRDRGYYGYYGYYGYAPTNGGSGSDTPADPESSPQARRLLDRLPSLRH